MYYNTYYILLCPFSRVNSQAELRTVLGVPPGPAGVGITVDRDRLQFEFAEVDQIVELSESDLRRRIADYTKSKV